MFTYVHRHQRNFLKVYPRGGKIQKFSEKEEKKKAKKHISKATRTKAAEGKTAEFPLLMGRREAAALADWCYKQLGCVTSKQL